MYKVCCIALMTLCSFSTLTPYVVLIECQTFLSAFNVYICSVTTSLDSFLLNLIYSPVLEESHCGKRHPPNVSVPERARGFNNPQWIAKRRKYRLLSCPFLLVFQFLFFIFIWYLSACSGVICSPGYKTTHRCSWGTAGPLNIPPTLCFSAPSVFTLASFLHFSRCRPPPHPCTRTDEWTNHTRSPSWQQVEGLCAAL